MKSYQETTAMEALEVFGMALRCQTKIGTVFTYGSIQFSGMQTINKTAW